MNDVARRTSFWIGWAFGRIGQLLEEHGTQNDNGEWRVVHFSDPLGPAITNNRPRIKW